jgi:hypothetical protein
MLKTSVKLTAASALLAFAALGAAFALPTDGARQAGASLAGPTGIEQVQYRRSARCFRQCLAGRRYRSCQNDAQGKENCCSQRCRRRG